MEHGNLEYSVGSDARAAGKDFNAEERRKDAREA
jgi:hypothetical protein